MHHGLFWGPGVQAVDEQLKRRLQILLDANIALAAYHLPLDAHPEVGNNALLARAARRRSARAVRAAPWPADRLQLATLPNGGLPAQELFALVERVTARTPLVFDAGPATVNRLAIVSGAGADHIAEAAPPGPKRC